MIWDPWIGELERLSSNAAEWRAVGEFVSKIQQIAARKLAEQGGLAPSLSERDTLRSDRVAPEAPGPPNSDWMKNVYSMADVERDED